MEDKVAINKLKGLLEKYPLDEEEKEAVLTAIGILAWTKLTEGRMKNLKKGHDRRMSSEE
jgi:hypothetical protein